MAEDHTSGPYEVVWLVVGILVVLIVLWWVRGGPERANLRSIFLNTPPPTEAPGQ